MASGKKEQGKAAKAAEIGAGVLAAAAAAGAGYYFYGDKNAKKHRAAASKWAKGMKADVLKEAKKLKKIDQKTVATVVDKAAAAYASARSVDKKDVAAAARELKKQWKKVEAEISKAKTSVRAAKKSVKKTVSNAKKTAKKSAKKSPAKAKKASPKRAR
jgi:hypothetical protein